MQVRNVTLYSGNNSKMADTTPESDFTVNRSILSVMASGLDD